MSPGFWVDMDRIFWRRNLIALISISKSCLCLLMRYLLPMNGFIVPSQGKKRRSFIRHQHRCQNTEWGIQVKCLFPLISELWLMDSSKTQMSTLTWSHMKLKECNCIKCSVQRALGNNSNCKVCVDSLLSLCVCLRASHAILEYFSTLFSIEFAFCWFSRQNL